MLDSKAITKIKSLLLIAIILIAASSGVVAYYYFIEEEQYSKTIKIGVLADLDAVLGRNTYQGAVLAAEQINSQGGILGRQVEVIGEDHDVESGQDMTKVSLALTKLLTSHKVDFVIGQSPGEVGFICQDIVAEHQKIFFEVASMTEDLTQRVLDDYDKYKYFFRMMFNASSTFSGITDSLLVLRENTGFNKVGYLAEDLVWAKGITDGFDSVLPDIYGFDLVYKGSFPSGTVDFSSYLAAIEAAGVEVLLPLIWVNSGIPVGKEWFDRQSPFLIYGGILAGINDPKGWEWTDGKCEHLMVAGAPISAGYPLTSKTLSTRETYVNRWNEIPWNVGAAAYDVISNILSDAIEKAGTIDSEEVIKALEETSIETSQARNFVFTSSHDMMVGENVNDPSSDYQLAMVFQWQNGQQVPVYPKKIMDEAGVTYTFPDWPGPWDNIS